MTLLYQTTSKAFAVFLSFFMKMEAFEVRANGAKLSSNGIGTISIVKGRGVSERITYTNGIANIENLSVVNYKTAGINKKKVISYVFVIGGLIISTYSLGAGISGSPIWGLDN